MTPEQIDAVIQLGKQAAIIAGAVGTFGSVLAGVLPKHWPVTQLLARLFADTRDIRAKGDQAS